ncbi:MAG: Z1 domain-containing protein [Chitinophagales bacterium]|nr:Z1 domain-containing protein [Chitinophagales bacterium]
MLVKWIDRVAYLVNEKTKQYKYAIQSEDELILADLKNIFEEDFSPTTKNVLENLDYLDIRIKEHNWEDVKNELKNAVLKIDVRSVHGTRSTTNLEYHNIEEIDYKRYDNGLSVIAVGGSRLSRGITLEGLSVSYYLRTTRMYDSLMQMGRWFGYRPGYVDLCRLFSTSLIFSWFNHITFATEEMRNDFDELTMTHNLPRDFKLKVRNHHGQLTITSLNKLYFSEDIHISFSGENPQTYCLLKTRNAIENNFNALNKLVSNIGLPKDDNIIVLRDRTRYLLYPNSNIDAICNFIDSFQIEQPSINNATLTEYIKVQSKGNKIKEWSICIVSNTDEKVFIDHTGKASRLERKPNEDVATYQLQHNGKVITMGCSVRNQKNGRDSDYYFISKNQIDQTGDRYVDLMITGGSYKEIKEQRKTERKGLLLIYALDERCTPNINYGIPIVGYSIHFPRIDDETKVSYKVSLNRELDDEVMVDDDNPLNDVL